MKILKKNILIKGLFSTFPISKEFTIEPYLIDYYYDKNGVSVGVLSGYNNRYFLSLNYNGYMQTSAISASVQVFRIVKIGLGYEKSKENSGTMLSLAVVF